MKVKLLFLVLITALFAGSALPQINPQWISSYNGSANGQDEALSHVTDNSGNTYVAGKVTGAGSGFDYGVIKYNSTGNALWEQRYNGPGNGNDIAHSIAIDIQGNVYVTGESAGTNSTKDYATIKYDQSGAQQWVARYNNKTDDIDIPSSIVVDAEGNSYVTGLIFIVGQSFNFATVKYNSAGVEQWVRIYSGASNGAETNASIAIDNAGNVYVAGGSFQDGTANFDFITIKYNTSGTEQWVRLFNGASGIRDEAVAIKVDAEGDIVVSGTTIAAGTGIDFLTVKYNPSGTVLWSRVYDASANGSSDEVKDLATDALGNIFVTGSSVGISSSYDFATVKYTSTGDEAWVKRYNGPASFNFDEPRSVTVDNNGNAYVTGLSLGLGTLDDMVVIKYTPEGNEQWVGRYNSPFNGIDVGNTVTADAEGNVYVSGFVTSGSNGRDIAIVKYSQLTGVQNAIQTVPDNFILSQNYPNPFNPSTVIQFSLPVSSSVKLTVYNSAGEKVGVLIDDVLSAGMHEFQWNAFLQAAGVYYYKLTSSEFTDSKVMMLVK